MSEKCRCNACGHIDNDNEFTCDCCGGMGEHDCGAQCIDCDGRGIVCPKCGSPDVEDIEE